MAKSLQKPTPRQIAFFMFMGVDGVEEMTKEEVGGILDTGFADWWFSRFGRDPEQVRWFYMRSSEWEFQRIILYQDLYPSERREFLERTVIEEVGTYVRGQFTGSSERITRAKLLEVADLMLTEDPNWWHGHDKKKAFLAQFQKAFPRCCDGRRPERSASGVQTASIINRVQMTASKNSSNAPPRKPFAHTGEIIHPFAGTGKARPTRMNRRVIVIACLAISLAAAQIFFCKILQGF